MPRRWILVTIGCSTNTMAPARMSGGQMIRTVQNRTARTAMTAAIPTSAHETCPARRMRSITDRTLRRGGQPLRDDALDAAHRVLSRALVTELLDERHHVDPGGELDPLEH